MLDFDGVLHHAQGAAVADFAFAHQLDAALDGHRCEVVISSTWREHYSIEQLRMFLPTRLGARVIDVLGPDHRGPHVRHKNVLDWVARQSSSVDWRALDDARHEFPEGCDQLILCDGSVGLSARECRQIRVWLAGTE